MVRETHLARARHAAAADEPRRRDGVVRRSKRTRRERRARRRQQAGHRVDRRHLERLVLGERRQDRRQPARQHRLPRPGRTDQQARVTAGRRDLERALRRVLPDDVGEVGAVVRGRGAIGRLRVHERPTLQRLDQLANRREARPTRSSARAPPR